MKESKVESLNIPLHNLPSCKTISGFDSNDKTVKELIIYDSKNTNQIEITSNKIIVSTDAKICSGALQTFLQFVPTKCICITELYIAAPQVFEDCPNCGASGLGSYESVTKKCQYIRHKIHISKRHFDKSDISLLIESLKTNRTLHQIKLTSGNILSYKHLTFLNQSTRANVIVEIEDCLTLSISIKKDNNVYINISNFNKVGSEEPSSLFLHLFEQKLPPELQGVIVTADKYMSNTLLTSLGKSTIVTSLTLSRLDSDVFTKFASDFQEMLENTRTLQTLTFHFCELSNTFIKHLEDVMDCLTIQPWY